MDNVDVLVVCAGTTDEEADRIAIRLRQRGYETFVITALEAILPWFTLFRAQQTTATYLLRSSPLRLCQRHAWPIVPVVVVFPRELRRQLANQLQLPRLESSSHS